MNLKKDGSPDGLRPPYLDKFETVESPLFVLPVFLSRADATPENERPRDPANVVDGDGNLIRDLNGGHSALAFEADANISFEKWDEYWRKVHGPRFTYEEGPEDKSMRVLLRYDQIHRVPGGPTSGFPPPYYAPVDANAKLHASVIGRIAPYNRPSFDGLAYMAFRSYEDMVTSFGSGKFPAKIVPEERVMFRAVTHMVTQEYIIVASPRHRDAVSLVKIHRRAADLTRGQFQERWLRDHAPKMVAKPATHQYVRRYAQLHNIGPAREGDLFWHPVSRVWDGITVMSFSCVADLEDFIMSDDYNTMLSDEAEYSDLSLSEYWTGINYNIINRLYPEVVSKM